MKTLLKPLALLLLLALGTQAVAQNKGYKITLKIDKLPQGWVKMGYYYGALAYLIDSQRVEKTKLAYTFSGKSKLTKGFYFFALPESPPLDFIADTNQNFVVETEFSHLKDSVFAENSTENEQYYEYLRYFSPRENEIQGYNAQISAMQSMNNKEMATMLENQKQIIVTEINTYIRAYIKLYPENLQTKVLVAGKNVVVPDSIPKTVNKKANYAYYRHIIEHFWDSYDFKDPRLVRTKVFDKKLTTYFEQVVPKNPDSSIAHLDKLLLRAKNTDETTYQAMVIWIANHFDKIDVMGFDAIYIYIAEKYLTPKAAPWLNLADRTRTDYKVGLYKNTLLGNETPPIALVDTLNKPIYLKDIEADYTFLMFYSPKCSHCIEEMPKFYELFQKYEAKNVKAIAISIDKDEKIKKEWRSFIRKNGWNWVNATPADTETKFQETFAAYNLPVVYLLDSNKKILMKRLSAAQFDKHLDQIIR